MFIYSNIFCSCKHLQYTHKIICNLHEIIILVFIYYNILCSTKYLQYIYKTIYNLCHDILVIQCVSVRDWFATSETGLVLENQEVIEKSQAELRQRIVTSQSSRKSKLRQISKFSDLIEFSLFFLLFAKYFFKYCKSVLGVYIRRIGIREIKW